MDEETPQNTPGHVGPLQIAPIAPLNTGNIIFVPCLPAMLLPVGNKHLLSLRNASYEFNDLSAITPLPMEIKKQLLTFFKSMA